MHISFPKTPYSSEQLLAAGLVFMQVSMSAVLLLVIVSPWYSVYFNKTLADQIIDNCRDPRSAESMQKLPELRRLAQLSNSVIDMHLDEEAVLASLRRRAFSPEALKNLRVWTASAPDNNLKAIAREKLIRCDLLAAKILLEQGDWQTAEEHLKQAMTDLKQQSQDLAFSPQRRYINSILETSAECRKAAGRPEEADLLLEVLASLADPQLAKKWYEKNGLNGYDRDYSPEYIIRHALVTPDGAQGARARALRVALEQCEGNVLPSTRFGVLRQVLRYGNQYDPALSDSALQFWLKYCASTPITEPDQAYCVMDLMTPAMRTKSADVVRQIRVKTLNACADKLLPSESTLAQQRIDSFMQEAGAMDHWPPKPGPEGDKFIEEVNELIAICKRDNLDDMVPASGKAWMLSNGGLHIEEAGALLDQLVDRSVKYQLERHRQHCLSNALVTYVNELNAKIGLQAKPHTQARERMLHAVELLEKAYKGQTNWQDDDRIGCLAVLDNDFAGLGLPERAKPYTAQLEQLAQKGAVTNCGLALHFIHHAVLGGDMDKGQRIYESYQNSSKNDAPSKFNLTTWMLGYLRAYPACLAANMQAAKDHRFPWKEFHNVPALCAKVKGEGSTEHLCSLLYLAQYEMCIGNNARAVALCKSVMKNNTPLTTQLYVPAADMVFELTGVKDKCLSQPQIESKLGTITELDCLYSIYYQLHNDRAWNRALLLKKQIREKV